VKRFRQLFRVLAPRWLTTGHGELVFYSLGLIMDAFAQRGRESILARFPDFAPDDALSRMGHDRRIVRGFDEPRETYSARLKRFLDDWKKAGMAPSILRQVLAYLAPHELIARTVNATGTWVTVDADGVVSQEVTWPTPNWDWDGDPDLWARFWVILYPPATLWDTDGTWGDPGTWGDGGTWGTTATPEQVESVRSIVRDWKPGAALAPYIIIAFDGASFDPESSAGLPDGTWGTWGTGGSGARVPTRLDTARYWKGAA
jgi:hypothetical protein